MKILADDGTQFDTIDACLAHEATLPYLKLLNDVEAAVAQDAAFAAKIEALGTRLARERRERGDLRRKPNAKDAPDPPASANSTERPSSDSDGGSSQSKPDARTDEAA